MPPPSISLLFGPSSQQISAIISKLIRPSRAFLVPDPSIYPSSPTILSHSSDLSSLLPDPKISQIFIHTPRGLDLPNLQTYLLTDPIPITNLIVVLDDTFFDHITSLQLHLPPLDHSPLPFANLHSVYAADLLVQQVELANLILFPTKVSQNLSSAIKALNRDVSTASISDLDTLPNTFDPSSARSRIGWLSDLRAHNHQPNLPYKSFVYRRRRPMHPERLAGAFLSLANQGLLRGKGTIWLASRNNAFGEWTLTGSVWSFLPGGIWFTCLPIEKWPSRDEEFVQNVGKDMHSDANIGDRRQEIVFIGLSFEQAQLESQLDACLLDDKEMEIGVQGWSAFTDPFEEWEFSDDESEGEDEDEEGWEPPNKRVKPS